VVIPGEQQKSGEEVSKREWRDSSDGQAAKRGAKSRERSRTRSLRWRVRIVSSAPLMYADLFREGGVKGAQFSGVARTDQKKLANKREIHVRKCLRKKGCIWKKLGVGLPLEVIKRAARARGDSSATGRETGWPGERRSGRRYRSP